jgi:hypothetical protein
LKLAHSTAVFASHLPLRVCVLLVTVCSGRSAHLLVRVLAVERQDDDFLVRVDDPSLHSPPDDEDAAFAAQGIQRVRSAFRCWLRLSTPLHRHLIASFFAPGEALIVHDVLVRPQPQPQQQLLPAGGRSSGAAVAFELACDSLTELVSPLEADRVVHDMEAHRLAAMTFPGSKLEQSIAIAQQFLTKEQIDPLLIKHG